MADSQCPVTGMRGSRPDFTKGTTNRDWWPNQLDLSVLAQNNEKVSPLDADFDYIEAFKKLDLKAVKEDLKKLMTDSQDWWPADYGHYGGLFIRMAWHSAGTYRTMDGRGGSADGTQRFAPLNSWPDNANLDKARRLLWPIKKKYGQSISWADLMILTGNVALESMGFPTFGYGGGRLDVWQPQEDVYWGAEKIWLAADGERYDGDNTDFLDRVLDKPLAAVQMGLIYVNPEGPNGEPDILASGKDVRETFTRMGMKDDETVALIAGGHTFGKTHGAHPDSNLGKEPEGAPIEEMGLGWKNAISNNPADTITSGLEGAWKPNPINWDQGYLKVLFKYDWNLEKSPAGHHIWVAVNVDPEDMVFDAAGRKNADGTPLMHRPMMTTADMSLKFDPGFKAIAEEFANDFEKFQDAFGRAWYKLTHRDMGPKTCLFGDEVPSEDLIWQDPIPAANYELSDAEIADLKKQLLDSGLSISQLVQIAWASASTYRSSDNRGGANGARIRLEPQIDWDVNSKLNLKEVLPKYEAIAKAHGKVSVADLIVLGGAAAIEAAAKKAGVELKVPFECGRMDAVQEQTEDLGQAVLEPIYDGFRNYLQREFDTEAEKLLVDKAQLLGLTTPEMTVLVGGLRVLGNNFNNSEVGVLTDKKETLTNDFFVNLLDMKHDVKTTSDENLFEIVDRASGKKLWDASRVDLIFGSNSVLRANSEVYASDDAKEKFYRDFVKAWNKVMNADRFDLFHPHL